MKSIHNVRFWTRYRDPVSREVRRIVPCGEGRIGSKGKGGVYLLEDDLCIDPLPWWSDAQIWLIVAICAVVNLAIWTIF